MCGGGPLGTFGTRIKADTAHRCSSPDDRWDKINETSCDEYLSTCDEEHVRKEGVNWMQRSENMGDSWVAEWKIRNQFNIK